MKRGRELYLQRCGGCHTLHHEGGKLGPDLTSWQRGELDDLLMAILLPSVEIREGFELVTLTLTNQRVISGFIDAESPSFVRLRQPGGGLVTVPDEKIDRLETADVSLMPANLLKGLEDQELRDLFAYLRSTQPLQVK